MVSAAGRLDLVCFRSLLNPRTPWQSHTVYTVVHIYQHWGQPFPGWPHPCGNKPCLQPEESRLSSERSGDWLPGRCPKQEELIGSVSKMRRVSTSHRFSLASRSSQTRLCRGTRLSMSRKDACRNSRGAACEISSRKGFAWARKSTAPRMLRGTPRMGTGASVQLRSQRHVFVWGPAPAAAQGGPEPGGTPSAAVSKDPLGEYTHSKA